jgi:hypothetical protein
MDIRAPAEIQTDSGTLQYNWPPKRFVGISRLLRSGGESAWPLEILETQQSLLVMIGKSTQQISLRRF